jgi:NTP pyrophosphatase (non-canonical NTP hydrolase)
VELEAFQRLMAETYGARDGARGRAATIAWLAEEVGELAQAVRKGDRAAQAHELGDVLAWLASLANQLGITFDEAISRFTDADGCPTCRRRPCTCAT